MNFAEDPRSVKAGEGVLPCCQKTKGGCNNMDQQGMAKLGQGL
jgi:hypothetical protein